MRRFTQSLACIVFWLLSLLPVALFTIDGPWPGVGELRMRAREPFPQRITPHIFRDLDRWFIDRIGLRLSLVSTGAAFHIGLLQRSTDRRVVIGRDGWLFWIDDGNGPATMADFRGALRFTDAELRAAERHLLAMRDVSAACGVRGLVAVAPNKQSVYGEYLNNSGVRPSTRLDDLLSRLGVSARAMILDLRVPLRAAKAADPARPIYFKTDSHWNDLGAFYAYRAVITALAQSMPVGDLALASPEQYEINIVPFDDGDLAINMLSSPGRFKDVQVLLRRKTASGGGSQTKLGGQMLLIGDSFSLRLSRYFARHFSAFRLVSHGGIPEPPFRADGPQPSAIVFEIAERNLTNIAEWDFDWKRFCPH
jgi:alginate O-acetyltransferase complex protein AlgJ